MTGRWRRPSMYAKRQSSRALDADCMTDWNRFLGILNANACIAYPQIEDEYLTKDSVRFHEKLGYEMVGTFHQCGYKFGRWYDMVWMEKMIGEHRNDQPAMIPFPEIGDRIG